MEFPNDNSFQSATSMACTKPKLQILDKNRSVTESSDGTNAQRPSTTVRYMLLLHTLFIQKECGLASQEILHFYRAHSLI